jgi:hypothetical protein
MAKFVCFHLRALLLRDKIMNKKVFDKTPDSRKEAKLLVKDLFPKCNARYCFNPPCYRDLINTMCDEIMIESSDHNYQGSTFCLLRKGDKYGYLEFGWGSCSVCDALQAVTGWDDLQQLYDNLNNSIRWFDSTKDFYKWCKEDHDWEGSFAWHDGARGFIKQVDAFFGE